MVLSCRRCLYILEINPLSVTSFADIAHSVCWLSFCSVSFAVQKLSVSLAPMCLLLFYGHSSRRWTREDVAGLVRERLASVQRKRASESTVLYGVLNPFLVCFVHAVRVRLSTGSCPVFPAPSIEGTFFPLLCFGHTHGIWRFPG